MNIFSFKGRISRLKFLIATLVPAFFSIFGMFHLLLAFYIIKEKFTIKEIHYEGASEISLISGSFFHIPSLISTSIPTAVPSNIDSDASLNTMAGIGLGIIVIIFLVTLALFWVYFAANVKRFHDLGQSGAWSLLNLVPGLGYVIWIILLVMPGQKGRNTYGYDPLATPEDEAIARRSLTDM